MKKNFLSIVTPTLNSEMYLEKTILSVINLRDNGANYCIVDSGSTDRTLEIAKSYNVDILYYPAGNMFSALNHGFKKTNAEWITYINSDDLIHEKAVMASLTKFGDSADVIYGGTDYIDSSDKLLYSRNSPKVNYLRDIITAGIMPFAQPGTLFRRSVFDYLNGFNVKYKYCSDFDFITRAYLADFLFMYYEKSSMSSFRVHDQQLSQMRKDEMDGETLMIINDNDIKKKSSVLNIGKIAHRFSNVNNWIYQKIREFNKNI